MELTACRGELRLNVLRPTQGAQRQQDLGDRLRVGGLDDVAEVVEPDHRPLVQDLGTELLEYGTTMKALAHYWARDYDWRKCERRLNALPNFITEIDGLDIHFIHVRSDHEDALPLIVTHGWPGSIIEQLDKGIGYYVPYAQYV